MASTAPVQETRSAERRIATIDTSVPASTIVVAIAAASTARNCGVSQSRRRGAADLATGGSAPSRTGGLVTNSAVPATSKAPAMASMVTRAEVWVTSSTASVGPAMNETSTDIESNAYAWRRWSIGTSAAVDWRITENTGSASRPVTNEATGNAG